LQAKGAQREMNQIIQKAIEGGWRGIGCEAGVEWILENRKQQELVCDPSFWQALGKACGWECEDTAHPTGKDRWQHYAFRFHEINLTEDWDKAIAYLEDLIK
jgi:hypothetical protein